MSKDYKVSNDGTIFEIKEDGSISKLARIDENGNVFSFSSAPKTQSKGSVSVYWFFILILVIIIICLGISYSDMESQYSYVLSERNEYKSKYENVSSTSSSLNSQITTLRQEKDGAKSELSRFKNKISSVYPLIITDIEIANVSYEGNVETNYGYSIYSYNTMYLKPRIKYSGLTSGYETLKIKWYNPDGTIKRGTSSPISAAIRPARWQTSKEWLRTF